MFTLQRVTNVVHWFCILCWVFFGSAIGYFWYQSDIAPVIISSVSVNDGGVANRENYNTVSVSLKRNLNRSCDVDLHLSLQTSNGKWIGGVFDLSVGQQAVVEAHKKTPDRFIFDVFIPYNVPTGKSGLFGKAFFHCKDNPLHSMFPSSMDIYVPLTIQ